MAEVGLGQVAKLELDRYDDTTRAFLAVYGPVDAVGVRRQAGYSATNTDNGKTWTAVVAPYDVGGLWYHVWSVDGMGYGRIVFEVPVVPDRLADPVGTTYATSADLANWMRDAPPADCERMLVAATREVDLMLLAARYPVDDLGFPTDPIQRAAVRDAVCELVSWWNDTGDETGAIGIYGSLSAGSISVGRATSGQAKGASVRVSRQVLDILAGAGLAAQPPTVI